MEIYNIKTSDGTLQTLNIVNINNQLNGLTELLNGLGNGGSISDTQLQSINKRITDISKSLESLKTDVDKYIDETELQVKISNIDNTLSSKVDNNTFITNINSITSQLSTISGQLSTLSSSLSNMDLSNYYDKLQTEARINEMVHDNITLIESAWKDEIVKNITTDIESKLNIFKKDITDTVKNEVESKLTALKTEMGSSVDDKLKEYKKISEYTQEMTNYARLDQLNNFRENITLDKNLNVSGTFTGNGMNIGSNKVISYDTELKLGNQSLPLNILSNGNIKINGNEIDFNNLNGGNITLPNNLVYNNHSNDFTILPTYNSLNFATEKYVNDEIKKVSNIQLPSNLAKTDTQTDFTAVPTINGINIATIQDISNSISNIPQYQLPSTVVKNDSPNDFKILPTFNGLNFATETFVSNEIGKINFTIPENYVRNNVKTDFTYVPTISGIDIATKTYVDDEVAKIPKVTLPETMVKTDIENNFTITPKINGTNIATTLDISNSISQIPQYNLPSNVVKNDTPTDFTVVPQINGKDITTKEYVDTEVSKVSYTLPSTVVHNNTSNNFTVLPTVNNINLATENFITGKLSEIDYSNFAKLNANNVFTGNNTMNNINLRGQILFSNNPLFLFQYMYINNATTSVFHLGNANFPLNLLAKDGMVMLNGKPFNSGKFEIVFEGAIPIILQGNIENFGEATGIVVEYDYSRFVQNKDYNFIYFKIEDNNNSEFNYMIYYDNSYCDTILCLKGKTVIKKIDYSSNDSFFVKIDDNSKKLYMTIMTATLGDIYIKNISIF